MSDPITAEAADGTTHEFPAETNPAVIDRVMKQYAMQSKIRARYPKDSPFANKTVSNIASEAMGAVDPILGLNSLLDKGVYGAGQLITSVGGLAPNPVSKWMGEAAHSGEKVYDMADKALQDQRASSGQSGFDPFRLAGNFAASAALPGGAAGDFTGAVGAGASYGAMQPTHEGASPVENVENAAMGGVGGAAGYELGKGISALTSKSPAPPTTAQLKSSADYKSFATKPVTLTPDAVKAIGDKVGQSAIQHAMNEAEINQETHLVSELGALLNAPAQGQSVTTEAADKIRQSFDTLGRAAAKDSPNAARGWNSRSDAIETAIQQTPEINAARNTWAQFRKSEILDKTIAAATDAQGTPAGFGDTAQALRREFLKLARSKKFASFSADEQKAITDVANGTLTTNTLQQLGKFSPVRGHLTRLLELGGGLGGAALAGGGAVGALPAIGLATVGEAARQGSNYATSRAARLASELVRRGGPAVTQTSPKAAALAQALQATGRIPPALLAQALQASGAGAPIGR